MAQVGEVERHEGADSSIVLGVNNVLNITEKVEALWYYYDNEHAVDTRMKRDEIRRMIGEVECAFPAIDSLKGTEKALWAYLKGRALSTDSDRCEEASQLLQMAVKTDPALLDAWNVLGQLNWRQGDFKGAKNCFASSLQLKKNAFALRGLSMIIRRMTNDEKSIDASIDHAKEAVKLDANDGLSWYILGNALLTKAFSGTASFAAVDDAFKAYMMAEKNMSNPIPDLYLNRGNAHLALEDYDLALRDYAAADLKDPKLECGERIVSLLKFVKKVSNQITSVNSKIVVKKLKGLETMLATLEAVDSIYNSHREEFGILPALPDSREINTQFAFIEEAKQAVQQMSMKSRQTAADIVGLLEVRVRSGFRKAVSLKDLRPGQNKGVMLICRFAAPIFRESSFPISFIVGDANHCFGCVSIYYIASTALSEFAVGETLFVMDPTLKPIRLENPLYSCVQVTSPDNIFTDRKTMLPRAQPIVSLQHS